MFTNNEFEDVMFTFSRLMRERMTFNCFFASQLSLLQLHVLIFLKKRELTQMSDISENLHIEKPTATSLLNKLVALKLVRRKANKKDRRIVHIELTAKGEEVLQEAMEQRNNKLSIMLSYLSMEDKKTLLHILKKIVTNMEKDYEK